VEEERSTAERAAVNQGSYDLFFFSSFKSTPDPVAPVPLGVSSYANTALRDALKLLWRPTPDRLPDARPATPRFADFSPHPNPLRSITGRRFNWTIPAPRYTRRNNEHAALIRALL